MTGRRTRRVAAVFVHCIAATALLLAAAACGSGSGSGQPTSVIVLSNALTQDGPKAVDAAGTVESLGEVSVTLSVGQTLAVRYTEAAVPQTWSQAQGGDAQVLRADPVATHSSCPSPAPAGCGPQLQQTYTALKAGKTSVVWQFGPCRKIVGNSVVNC